MLVAFVFYACGCLPRVSLGFRVSLPSLRAELLVSVVKVSADPVVIQMCWGWEDADGKEGWVGALEELQWKRGVGPRCLQKGLRWELRFLNQSHAQDYKAVSRRAGPNIVSSK